MFVVVVVCYAGMSIMIIILALMNENLLPGWLVGWLVIDGGRQIFVYGKCSQTLHFSLARPCSLNLQFTNVCLEKEKKTPTTTTKNKYKQMQTDKSK